MKKRILSVLLCLCMVCMLLPTTALATDFGHDGHTCGESCTHHANDPHRTVITENWKAWTNTVAASQNVSGKTASNSLPNTAGNYYLTKDVELSGTWEPADGVVLCLNGKTITGADGQEAIRVNRGVTFTLTDCHTGNEVGQITHETGQKGRGVYVNGTFNMYGGSITGNSTTTQYNADSKGGGVYVTGENAAFNMCGGSITGNTAAQDGGGVYVENGKFKMTAGTIGGTATENANTAKNGGGVYVVDSNPGTVPTCTFDITGGSITGNQASEKGGGVFVGKRSTFNMIGGTIGGTATENANTAKYGGGVAVVGTFNMSDNAAITGNTAETGGGVYVSYETGSIIAYGKFTMSGDAAITGNTTVSGGNGGGVYVDSGSTFTMSGGEITGNTAPGTGDGGGVFVNYDGTFQMSDNSRITGNTGFHGGGVSVERSYSITYNPGAFTMSSGNITNNNATYGGGVYISGDFTMSGGEISSNQATGDSGGVHMNTDSTFTVSGAPKITSNTLTNDTINNVRLSKGTSSKPDATITIGDGHLSTGASIGVTTERTLTTVSSVTIATGAQSGDETYFTSDAGRDYHFVLDGDEVKLGQHEHNWRYTLSEDKTTITATCGNAGCISTPYSETLTISASNATYDGTAKAAALSANKALISGLKDISATYEKYVDDTWTNFDGTPTDAGKYKASIKVGTGESAVTASVEYTIAKADGSLTAPTAKTGLVYNGSGQALVTAGAGTGTVWYSLDNTNWNTVIPTGTNAGSYTVYYKLVGDVNHNDAAGGSVDVTIDKADPTVTAPTAKTLTYTGSAQELVNAGSTDGGTMKYKVGSDGDWTDSIPTGTNADTYNVYYKVVGNSNYNNSAAAEPVAVTISKATPGGSNAAKYIRYNDTAEKTFTAADFDLDLAGTIAPSGDMTDSGSVLDPAYPKFDGGAIKVKLKDSLSFAENTTVTIPVAFMPSNTNYAQKNYTLTITLTDKDDVSGNITFNNGELTYTGTGLDYEAATITGVSGGTWTYTYAAGSSSASLDGSGKPLAVGTYTVTATYEDSTHFGTKSATLTVIPKTVTAPAADTTVFTYNGAPQTYGISATGDYTVTGNVKTAAGTYNVTVALADTTNTKWNDDTTADKTYTFTINKATPTGDPTYTAITASGKTLADAALTKNAGWPAGGTLKWVQADGTTELDSSTVVVANTSYKWLFTPSDTANYNTLTGSITPYVVSYSGGDYTPPTYKVESKVTEDTDGTVSFSKGNAKKDDTVTITVTPDRYYKVDGVTVKDKNGNEIAVTDNGDGTFTFQMPASQVTVEPAFSWDNPFTDVAEDTYYTPAVEWALKNDITNGAGDDTTFGPDAECTRAQIVTFLWRAAGCPEPAGISSFTDVSADAYYAKAVAWAVEQGITNGTGDGTTFSPDATCTRSQGVTFLYRSAGSPEVSDDIAFNDVTTGSYYSDAVVWATQNGVTDGTGNSKFSPVRDCTRAQIVTFLYRWMVK